MELLATVQDVRYPAPSIADTEPGEVWYIIKTDKGTAKGNMHFRPECDDILRLVGDWSVYQGKKEFKFTAAIKDIPIDPRDQLRYICQKTERIGIKIENQIWETWGENWIDEMQPNEIPRLTASKINALRESINNFEREKQKSEAICWLMGKGATMNMAAAAWDQWQMQTIGVVENDCYRLSELPNYGFLAVDQSIRHAFGIKDDDPRRIRSALFYAMQQLTAEGSTIVTWNELYSKVLEILRFMFGNLICEACKQTFLEGTIRAFPATQSVALGSDYSNEKTIWDYVRQ